VYFIQRGLAAISGTDMIPGLDQGMQIFFTTTGLAVLLCGFLLDQKPAKTLIVLASIVGSISVLGVFSSPVLFGIGFGMAAALLKLAPYTAPLKLKDGNEAVRIAPQAAAKNFGAALFILFLGGALKTLGYWTAPILSVVFLMVGAWAYKVVPDDRCIEGWNFKDILALAKKFNFWFFLVYCFWMVGLYYLVVKSLVPHMIADGYAKGDALLYLAIAFGIAGVLRWFWAYTGEDITGYVFPMVLGTIVLAALAYTETHSITELVMFTIAGSAHTPNYWSYAKQEFGKEKLGTVLGLGYVAMYMGAGVLYGSW
jgi:hypothetical protein